MEKYPIGSKVMLQYHSTSKARHGIVRGYNKGAVLIEFDGKLNPCDWHFEQYVFPVAPEEQSNSKVYGMVSRILNLLWGN